MNLFELFVKIGVDDSEVEPGIEKTKKSIANASNLISAKAVAIGNAMYDMGKQGINAFKKLAKIGIDYNIQMEQYTTNFTTMLGSQEAAVQKVEELKKFAASTPLSMDDLAKGTQTLLAFGVESENSTGILRQLGDIALGDADKMQRLSTAFGKATAAGKLSGEVVQQMIDAGWNPLIQISQAAGETMEETQKRMSAGAISVQELQAAMEAVTTGTGQFAGGMESASQTTQGLISTLQDNVKSKIGEAFQSVSNILQSEVLPRAIEFVNSINVDSVIESVNGLVSTFVELSPVIAAATTATLAYKAAVSISGVIDAVKKATEGQTIAQAALNAVMNANPFVLVATLIAAVGTALVTLYMTNEDFRNKVNSAWKSVKDTVSGVVSSLVTFFTETVPNAGRKMLEFFKSIPSMALKWGKDLIDNFISGIMQKWENLKDTVSNVAQSVKDFLGFSEPKKGPLSNFHTYAPDMMQLFAKGIKDNEHLITDQIGKSFDFGTSIVDITKTTGTVSTDTALASEIKGLRNDVKNLKIYLSTGALVGGVTDGIDQALGQKTVANSRRRLATSYG